MDVDQAEPNELRSVQATPIAQLHPEIADPNSKVVDGVVTITWPYSIVNKSIAFILAEHDVLLRRERGQVRVEFHGAAGKALESSAVGGGDEIRISLDGAEWGKHESQTRLPGTPLKWKLKFTNRLHMTIRRVESQEEETIDIDPSIEEGQNPLDAELDIDISVLFQTEEQGDSMLIPRTPLAAPPTSWRASALEQGEYASPAFLKRARVSYGSLFEGGLDIFDEEEARRSRKRRRRSRFSTTWRYSSRSPSPEAEQPSDKDNEACDEPMNGVETAEVERPPESPARPPMVDQGCQTQVLDFSLPMGVQVVAESRSTGILIQSTPAPAWRHGDLSSAVDAPPILSFDHPPPAGDFQGHGLEGMHQDEAHATPSHDYDFGFAGHQSRTDAASTDAFATPLTPGAMSVDGGASAVKFPFTPQENVFEQASMNIDPNLQYQAIDAIDHHPEYPIMVQDTWRVEASTVTYPTLPAQNGIGGSVEVPYGSSPTRTTTYGQEPRRADSDPLTHQTPRSPDASPAHSPQHDTDHHKVSSDNEDIESEGDNADALSPQSDIRARASANDEDEESQSESAEESEMEDHDLGHREHYQYNQGVDDEELVEEQSEEQEERHIWGHGRQDYDGSEEGYDEDEDDDEHDTENDYSEDEEDEDDEDEQDDGSDEGEEETASPPPPAAPKEPIVISLLSDSEDEEEQEAETRPQAENKQPYAAPQQQDAHEAVDEDLEMDDEEEGSESEGEEDEDEDEDEDVDEDEDEVEGEDAYSTKIAAISSSPSQSSQALSQLDGCDDDISHELTEVEASEAEIVISTEDNVADAVPNQDAQDAKISEPATEAPDRQELRDVTSPAKVDASAALEENEAVVEEEKNVPQPQPAESAEPVATSASPTATAKCAEMDTVDVDIPMKEPITEEMEMDDAASLIEDESHDTSGIDAEQMVTDQLEAELTEMEKPAVEVVETGLAEDAMKYEDIKMEEPTAEKPANNQDITEKADQTNKDVLNQEDEEDRVDEVVQEEDKEAIMNKELQDKEEIQDEDVVQEEETDQEVAIAQDKQMIDNTEEGEDKGDDSVMEEDQSMDDEAQEEIASKLEASAAVEAAPSPPATQPIHSQSLLPEEIPTVLLRQESALQLPTPRETQIDDSIVPPAETEAELPEKDEEDEEADAAEQQLMTEFAASQSTHFESFDGANDHDHDNHDHDHDHDHTLDHTLDHTHNHTHKQTHTHSPRSPRKSQVHERPDLLITVQSLRSHCRLHRKSLSADSDETNMSLAKSSPTKHCLMDDIIPGPTLRAPRAKTNHRDASLALARASTIALDADVVIDGGLMGAPNASDPGAVLSQSASPSSVSRRRRATSPPVTLRANRRNKNDHTDPSIQLAMASPRSTRPRNMTPTLRSPARSTRATNSPVSTMADARMSPSITKDESASTLKLQLSKSLRTNLPDYLPLKSLRTSLTKMVDILAVATANPPEAHRPKHGPRDYMLELRLTDPSVAPTVVNLAHIFRPHKASLPIMHAGDIILLRRVQVVSMQGRGFGLRAGDESAWAVFERGDEEMLPQIKGPPVEVLGEEVEHARGLARWWSALDDKARIKIEKANNRLSQAVKDGSR